MGKVKTLINICGGFGKRLKNDISKRNSIPEYLNNREWEKLQKWSENLELPKSLMPFSFNDNIKPFLKFVLEENLNVRFEKIILAYNHEHKKYMKALDFSEDIVHFPKKYGMEFEHLKESVEMSDGSCLIIYGDELYDQSKLQFMKEKFKKDVMIPIKSEIIEKEGIILLDNKIEEIPEISNTKYIISGNAIFLKKECSKGIGKYIKENGDCSGHYIFDLVTFLFEQGYDISCYPVKTDVSININNLNDYISARRFVDGFYESIAYS